MWKVKTRKFPVSGEVKKVQRIVSRKVEKARYATMSFIRAVVLFLKGLAYVSVITFVVVVVNGWLQEIKNGVVYEAGAEEPIETVVIERFVDEIPPIMLRIAHCESGNTQFDKHGKVVEGNSNVADRGRFQINRDIWGEKAKELGYDIETSKGNLSMAMWLYERKGTEPWIHSKKCWRN